MEICKAQTDDATEIALLHKKEISSGFLSTLGVDFLKLLYKFLIKNEIVFVAKEKSEVTGFVSCSSDKRKLYVGFILRNFFFAAPFILKSMFSKSVLRGISENLRSNLRSTTKNQTKSPELLSIAIKKSKAGSGIGSALLKTLERDLQTMQYKEYFVVSGAKLLSANNFYKKHGFQLKEKIKVHKDEESFLYFKNLI